MSNNVIDNTMTVPFEKSKMVSFVSSIMKNIVISPSSSRLPVKLIFCIAFRSAILLSSCNFPEIRKT